MSGTEEEDDRGYLVVINDEGEYSIWLSDKPVPNGWRTVGTPEKKAACLTRIGELWTDMRPKSVREAHARST